MSEFQKIDEALRPALNNRTFHGRICRLLEQTCDDIIRKRRFEPEMNQDPARVFSAAVPRSSVVAHEDRQKHWRKGASCVSLRHLDIINPEFMDDFIERTGIRPKSSLLHDSLRACEPLPKTLKAIHLRKVQNQEWALESVSTGAAYAKDNQMEQAMKAYKHALEIDSECVEAHVAIGAAFASSGKLEEGVKSFQKALAIDPTHNNARQYLNSTLLKLGRPMTELRQTSAATTVLIDQTKTPNPMQKGSSVDSIPSQRPCQRTYSMAKEKHDVYDGRPLERKYQQGRRYQNIDYKERGRSRDKYKSGPSDMRQRYNNDDYYEKRDHRDFYSRRDQYNRNYSRSPRRY